MLQKEGQTLLDLKDVFDKLRDDELTIIGEGVKAQFDNTQQTPLGFQWRGMDYEVLKLLHTSRDHEGQLQYLLLTDKGIYCLVLQREKKSPALCRSRWVLHYRVKEEPRQDRGRIGPPVSDFKNEGLLFQHGLSCLSLVPLMLANAAHYHGHLCPELAIGYRAALIAQRDLGLSRKNAHQFFILAENMSSAIESLQLISGCTIGNQNFFAYDMGKHCYYFGCFLNAQEPRKALRLALTSLVVDPRPKEGLEKRIISGQADQRERKEYQQAIDNAVQEILKVPEKDLFAKSRVSLDPPRAIGPLRYICCSCCGEVTAVEKCNPSEGGLFCRPCFVKTF